MYTRMTSFQQAAPIPIDHAMMHNSEGSSSQAIKRDNSEGVFYTRRWNATRPRRKPSKPPSRQAISQPPLRLFLSPPTTDQDRIALLVRNTAKMPLASLSPSMGHNSQRRTPWAFRPSPGIRLLSRDNAIIGRNLSCLCSQKPSRSVQSQKHL